MGRRERRRQRREKRQKKEESSITKTVAKHVIKSMVMPHHVVPAAIHALEYAKLGRKIVDHVMSPKEEGGSTCEPQGPECHMSSASLSTPHAQIDVLHAPMETPTDSQHSTPSNYTQSAPPSYDDINQRTYL